MTVDNAGDHYEVQGLFDYFDEFEMYALPEFKHEAEGMFLKMLSPFDDFIEICLDAEMTKKKKAVKFIFTSSRQFLLKYSGCIED